jgi:hypothetical protein
VIISNPPRSAANVPVNRFVDLYVSRQRRLLVGSISGLVAGTALALCLHNTFLGLILGLLAGGVYALSSRSTAIPSVENFFTAAALGFPLWTVLNTILIPAISGHGPRWSADEMRMLLPGLVGWIVYGATLGVRADRAGLSRRVVKDATNAVFPRSSGVFHKLQGPRVQTVA